MPTVQQISNQVSRTLGRLERVLKQLLLAFYNKYIKGSKAPIELIKQKHGLELRKKIAQYVNYGWQYSLDIMAKKTNLQVSMTEKDLNGMLRVAQRMEKEFWETARKNLQRESEYQVTPEGKLEEKPEFQTSAAMFGIGSFMLYLAFNSGILSKSQELNEPVILRFTTKRDINVDPALCKPEDGKIFGVNTNAMPPLHRHCRCKLIPIVAE